jgi:methylated-DNA-[protein]-cysteine S-methyltransferase
MTYQEIVVESPIGALSIVAAEDALVGLGLPGQPRVPRAAARDGRGHPVLERARRQLAEYFGGERRAFDLPLAPRGTPFQQAVWRALLRIPLGQTRSYGQIAAELGRRSGGRAVGAANARNPIAIVVPCHRVIGADGSLTGYAGGVAAKRWLLAHEQAVAVRSTGRSTRPLRGRPATAGQGRTAL